jgi:photosystem I P700 chlorophyll a apoprotein A2
LGLHTTTLILVKGALDARGSKLMPDKKILVTVSLVMVRSLVVLGRFLLMMLSYLAVFWMLNTHFSSLGNILLALKQFKLL